MHETAAEIAWLRQMLDQSFASMGEHMQIIVTPERRLTAEQVVALLQDTRHIALGTVSRAGEPYVMPVDALFLHGRFHGLTSAYSLRVQHLRERQSVSAAYFEKDQVGVTVHGTAVLIEPGQPAYAEVEDEVRRVYDSIPTDWTDRPVVMRIEPRKMFTFAMEPANFAPGPKA